MKRSNNPPILTLKKILQKIRHIFVVLLDNITNISMPVCPIVQFIENINDLREFEAFMQESRGAFSSSRNAWDSNLKKYFINFKENIAEELTL